MAGMATAITHIVQQPKAPSNGQCRRSLLFPKITMAVFTSVTEVRKTNDRDDKRLLRQ
jgi:hypothetical protein